MDIKRARKNHRAEQAKQLAARIYSYRLKCGLTQTKLGERIKLSLWVIHRAENGHSISISHFAQLQNFLTKNALVKEMKTLA